MPLPIGPLPVGLRLSSAVAARIVCIVRWLLSGPLLVSGSSGPSLRRSTVFTPCMAVITHGVCVARRWILWRLLLGFPLCRIPLMGSPLCLPRFARRSLLRCAHMCLRHLPLPRLGDGRLPAPLLRRPLPLLRRPLRRPGLPPPRPLGPQLVPLGHGIVGVPVCHPEVAPPVPPLALLGGARGSSSWSGRLTAWTLFSASSSPLTSE